MKKAYPHLSSLSSTTAIVASAPNFSANFVFMEASIDGLQTDVTSTGDDAAVPAIVAECTSKSETKGRTSQPEKFAEVLP